ncbi:conserved protein of unknown function [Pseudomonas sp. JV551A1]|uniref:Uncharacterized protein n=1 Tax=Pseudomonas inefficax TaxID=2078786 RepID=A0AAQ1P9U4_9PSED|nr:hypothetical protein [Pseudomonas]SPO54113.1 conserved protein of unknown function [Pseudomonas sp. JV551A1]SPO60395.1 conserved protein of unknown function [Pseudomonas inefficax]
MSFVPSCDSREDAINSLAQIYAVSSDDIERVLRDPTVQEIAQEWGEIQKPGFHYIVWHLLNAYPREDITHAYYYHSTSYGGCPSWFDEGLLGSMQGVGRFLDKIMGLIPEDKRPMAKPVAAGIVKLRSEYEGSAGDATGPWAWNTLTAASSSEDGMNFRIPEAIRDMWSSSFCGGGGTVDLREVIEGHLKPVVVKFKGKTTDIYDYCASLWAYLLSDDGECHLTHTFRGTGQTIPREDIAAVIDV